ncbi:MdtA/MuxA family multidrug efflux RND transporter periplasmic adaptor subunit [Azorhizophilus paspali]|uniref:MdtA/MuxA family multidrug efflux RND transporter periplasmic adaptor subunit n=1 Tax=Azorhizophilus paspali TaxID=69963 RepID=A0ABV6SRJ7_AZOPA
MSEPNLNPSSPAPRRRWLFWTLALLAVGASVAWWQWPALSALWTQSSPAAGRPGAGAPAMGRRPGGPGAPGGPAGAGGSFGGPVPVRVGEVRLGDFPVDLKALGTVTAYNTVNVRSRVDGELIKVLFREGQQVKAGDLLAVIDPRLYQAALKQAEGTLQQNRAQLRNAEIDLVRYKTLYAEDSVAKQTLDTQEALVAQYQGTVRSNLAAVEEAKVNLEYTQVRAPIAGRLGLRQVDVGNLVSSGDTTPLVTITQTLPISVSFTLPEGELPQVLEQVQADQHLAVEAWDRSERNRLAVGELESLDNQIDLTTGTVRLKARFENAEQRLFPNQFVNVRLRVTTREQSTLVPAAALQFGSKGTFVYVVGDDSKVQLRYVTAGPGDGTTTLIEQGLDAGERLVLEGTDRLRDGARVEVIDDSRPAVGEASGAAPAGRRQTAKPDA